MRASEERYRELFEGMDEGFCIIEVIFEGDRAVNYVLVDVKGRRMREIAPDHEQYWFDYYGEVARTGELHRFGATAQALGDRWYEVKAFRVGAPTQYRVAIVYSDVTQRRRDDAALRESEERQAFLLKLSDTLPPIANPVEAQRTGMRLLVECLGLDWTFYYRVERGPDGWGHVVDGSPWEPGTPVFSGLAGGETVLVAEVETLPDLTPEQRQSYRNAKIRAFIVAPLIEDGVYVAGVSAQSAVPRYWTPHEISIVQEVVECVWSAAERAHAETTLRQRETELARVQRIGEVGGIDIDIAGGMVAHRSPEYLRLHGLSPDTADETNEEWLARIYPEDRERASQVLSEALSGTASLHESEYRFVRPTTDRCAGSGRAPTSREARTGQPSAC